MFLLSRKTIRDVMEFFSIDQAIVGAVKAGHGELSHIADIEPTDLDRHVVQALISVNSTEILCRSESVSREFASYYDGGIQVSIQPLRARHPPEQVAESKPR